MALDTSTRDSSSSTMVDSTSPIPMPPNSSPVVMPNRSEDLSTSHEWYGNSSVSSQCDARGASSRSARSRASLRSDAWSSVSANGSMSGPMLVKGGRAGSFRLFHIWSKVGTGGCERTAHFRPDVEPDHRATTHQPVDGTRPELSPPFAVPHHVDNGARPPPLS